MGMSRRSRRFISCVNKRVSQRKMGKVAGEYANSNGEMKDYVE